MPIKNIGQDSDAAQSIKEVVYNEKYPPEFFDCIIVDECHRSIYNVWNQVLEYFDAFYAMDIEAQCGKCAFYGGADGMASPD